MNRSTLVFHSLLMILLFVLFLSDSASAKIYKWTDKHGRTHYSDHPPPETKLSKKIKEIPTNHIRPESGIHYDEKTGDEEGASDGETIDQEKSQQPGTHEIELYVTSWCTYCKKARKFFASRGIPITEYDIEKDSEAAARKKRLDSRRGVPFAVINGHRIHGYVPSAYERALKDGS